MSDAPSGPRRKNSSDASADLLTRAFESLIEQALAPLEAKIAELRGELEDLRQQAALPKLLTIKTAAEQLGVGRTKLYELLATTDLAKAIVPLPGTRGQRIDRDALLEWVAQLGESERRQSERARSSAPRLHRAPSNTGAQ